MIGGFFSRETELCGLSEEMIFEFPHFALAILVAGCFEMPRLYKGADAASGFDNTRSFQLQINLGDGVGVDAQVYGELSDRGQLVSNAKLAGSDCKPNRPFELVIERRRMRGINVKD